MSVARFAGIVVGSALALVPAACGGDSPQGADIASDSPSCEELPAACDPDPDEHEPPPLTREQLERYYVAQIAWRTCAAGEGFALSEPPSLEEFLAGGGAWWAGADLSDEDWNRIVGDESGTPGFDLRCGEPPLASDFLVAREALEGLYAWQVGVVACLEAEGFPLDAPVPPLEEFVRTGGTSWVPAREFTGRYGFPEGATWQRLATRCGSPTQDLWLSATDFEADEAGLESQYEANLALTACLEGAGFSVPDPPPLDEFVGERGWNWTDADIWAAVYRDNDRNAVQAFADGLDQACPGVG